MQSLIRINKTKEIPWFNYESVDAFRAFLLGQIGHYKFWSSHNKTKYEMVCEDMESDIVSETWRVAEALGLRLTREAIEDIAMAVDQEEFQRDRIDKDVDHDEINLHHREHRGRDEKVPLSDWQQALCDELNHSWPGNRINNPKRYYD
jgi:hypothetical protein